MSNTNTVMEQARALGQMIADSEEFKNLEIKDLAYQSDEEAQRLTVEYNKNREELTEQARKEEITPIEIMKIKQQLSGEFAKLAENKVISEYLEAKNQVDAMLKQVDDIIRFYVTGEEPGCGGSCSSCSGCH